jgi:hypothetical protein
MNKIKLFFTERRLRCLSVLALEELAGIPPKTLSHFLKGRRGLNKGHLENILPVLREFGYKD